MTLHAAACMAIMTACVSIVDRAATLNLQNLDVQDLE